MIAKELAEKLFGDCLSFIEFQTHVVDSDVVSGGDKFLFDLLKVLENCSFEEVKQVSDLLKEEKEKHANKIEMLKHADLKMYEKKMEIIKYAYLNAVFLCDLRKRLIIDELASK